MLVCFIGLPGVGKTTIAKLLAEELGAVYLRIDTIERGLIKAGILKAEILGHGYLVGSELATENLAMGRIVVADSVNSIALTRDWWRAAAAAAGKEILEVFVTCSDPVEHRRRVESRLTVSPEPNQPTWDEVLNRTMEPPPAGALLLDSAAVGPAEAVAQIRSRLGS